MNKKNKLACALALGFIGFGAQAQVLRQDITISANIANPASEFKVTPLNGTWPTSAMIFEWDAESSNFKNPTPLGFSVISSANVDASLASVSNLVNSAGARIAVDVVVKQVTSQGSTPAAPITLGLTPAKIYDATVEVASSSAVKSSYELVLSANKDNMTNGSGAKVSTPTPGTYSGVVNLVFESAI